MSTPSKVWSRFSGRSGDLKLRILDAPKDRMNESIDLYVKHYLAGESLSKAAGISKNPAAMEEYRIFAHEGLTKPESGIHVMICCIENDDDTIGDVIGVTFSYLSTLEDPFEFKHKPASPEIQKILQLSEDMLTLYNVLSEHQVDKCYDGFGIIVHPDYRGLGIAQEFLKARRLMSAEQGVPITAAWMTSIGTQKAAQRDGYETVHEFNFEEFGKKHGVTFEDVPKVCKLMMYKVL